MNVSTAGQRPRGFPNGLDPGARPVQNHRNASNMSAVSSASANDSRTPAGPEKTGAERAERFEDEKKRIIETCFGKKEEDGSGQSFHL